MADLGLADPMNASEALLKPVWVPRQVIVDHQVRATLQVHTFAGRIIRDHDPDDRIAVERGDCSPACLAGNPAMNDNDRPSLTEARYQFICKIFEGVFGFGENQDLSTNACGRVDHGRFVEDAFKLAPLGVLAGQFESQSARFEVLQDRDFGLEFQQRLRGRRRVNDLLFNLLCFCSGRLFQFIRIVARHRRIHGELGTRRVATDAFLPQPIFQSLATAFQ